jgi:hypothetical protein
LPIVPGRRGIARHVLATTRLLIGLVLVAFTVAHAVAVRPHVRSASHETDSASQSYDQFVALIQKPPENWDCVGMDMNRLLERLKNTSSPLPNNPAVVLGLIKQPESDLEIMRQAPPFDQEFRAILGELIAAETDLRDALKRIKSRSITLTHRLLAVLAASRGKSREAAGPSSGSRGSARSTSGPTVW